MQSNVQISRRFLIQFFLTNNLRSYKNTYICSIIAYFQSHFTRSYKHIWNGSGNNAVYSEPEFSDLQSTFVFLRTDTWKLVKWTEFIIRTATTALSPFCILEVLLAWVILFISSKKKWHNYKIILTENQLPFFQETAVKVNYVGDAQKFWADIRKEEAEIGVGLNNGVPIEVLPELSPMRSDCLT